MTDTFTSAYLEEKALMYKDNVDSLGTDMFRYISFFLILIRKKKFKNM